MTMCRFLCPVLATLLLFSCGVLAAQTDKQEKGAEEPSFETPVLQKAEIVDVVQATWGEVAERCRTEQPVEPPETRGRLLTLRAGGETYRIFLSEGRVVHCMDTEESDEQTAGPIDRELQDIAEMARRDLAEHLAVEPDAVEVRRAERVTWRDSSAGCPEPGQMYMQVLTAGARFFLTVSGVEYRYHQTDGGDPFLCRTPSPIEPLPGPEIR